MASYPNTVKHVQTETVMGARTARYAVEMARVLAGDEATLRPRPPLSALICCDRPPRPGRRGDGGGPGPRRGRHPGRLHVDGHAGSTGPATIAGTVVAGRRRDRRGADADPAGPPGRARLPLADDRHDGAAHRRLTWRRAGRARSPTWPGVELAHAWGVPTLAGVFGTDAPMPGWQSAGDAASSLMLCALAGAETGSGMGLLESCTLLYPEQLVLDGDLHERVRIDAAGLDTSREALALDVIRAVGPRGHFLYERHTRDELRRRRFSPLTGQPDGWVGSGTRSKWRGTRWTGSWPIIFRSRWRRRSRPSCRAFSLWLTGR